jgi:putative sigma-54 modulation protein
MDITVTFRRMEPAESLRAYAEEKVGKIRKYLDFPAEAHIVLSVEKFRHLADVTLYVNGNRIKGAEETEDMYSAIDQVMDKIEKQVKRYVSRIRDRSSENIKGEDLLNSDAAEETASLTQDEPAIESEKIVAKPMDAEEAAMQLNLARQDFLVFRNARTMEINVIYRRRDGNLGLIEPTN